MQLTHHSVEIRDNLVYKHGAPRALEIEALKTRLAAEIGKRSGLFCVPAVIFMDFANGTIATEFMPHLKNLREIALERRDGCHDIFQNAGRALAFVHRELQLPADKLVPLPDYLMSATGDNVVLHGDFSWVNVFCLEPERRIVLLDWASAPSLGGIATYGSRYFDLLWFSWSLFFWPPLRQVFHWKPDSLISAFIGGYAQVEPCFRWSRYIEYRSCIRPHLLMFWAGHRSNTPLREYPIETFLHVMGDLRWLRYPRLGVHQLGP